MIHDDKKRKIEKDLGLRSHEDPNLNKPPDPQDDDNAGRRSNSSESNDK